MKKNTTTKFTYETQCIDTEKKFPRKSVLFWEFSRGKIARFSLEMGLKSEKILLNIWNENVT